MIVAAAIYGTNFATVKMLDTALPLSISAALRFGLAAAVVSSVVFTQESDKVGPGIIKDRHMAMMGGMEIGFWYCIGYICQAEGLLSVPAGKVRIYSCDPPLFLYSPNIKFIF